MCIKMDSIGETAVTITVRFYPEGHEHEASDVAGCVCAQDENVRPFEVSFYDTPFKDNLLLPDGHRLAFLLKEVTPSSEPRLARLKVIEFPADYVLSGYRPSLAELKRIIETSHR